MSETSRSNAATEALVDALHQAGISCAGDKVTRTLYSTDASIYQIMPVCIAWPNDTSQVCAAVEIAKNHQKWIFDHQNPPECLKLS